MELKGVKITEKLFYLLLKVIILNVIWIVIYKWVMNFAKWVLDREFQLLTSLNLAAYVCVRKLTSRDKYAPNGTFNPCLVPPVKSWLNRDFLKVLRFMCIAIYYFFFLKLSFTSSALPMLTWKMQWLSVGLWKTCLGTQSNSMKMRKGNGKLFFFS